MDKTLGRIITILMMVILIGAFINVNQSFAEEEASDGRFIAYNDGTVWDMQTNLLWAARDNGSNIYWSDAETYCKTYDGGGYKGWRMPTRDELKGLYDRLIFGNNGYHLTKLITLTGGFPWAAEVQGSEAAVVAFNADHETWFWESVTHKSRNRALPVRDGKESKLVIAEKKQEEVVPPPPPPVQEKVSIALNLEFDTAKSVIKKKYHNNIKEVADFMQKYPDTKVVIEGHTDNVDVFHNPDNNIKLSQARADSVRQYLIDKFGIDASRITAIGYGPNQPIADNKTKEGQKKNRRVEAVIEKMVTKQPQGVVAPTPPSPPPPPETVSQTPPPQGVVAPPLPPPPPSETISQTPQQPVQEKVSIALNLEFDTAKSVIKKKYHNNIKEVADIMQKYPDTKVVIAGHTDNVDRLNDPDNNIKLSQARADSVRQYLIDKFGIDASRITAVGYGSDRPIADNNTKEGRKKNRRIEAVIEKIITK